MDENIIELPKITMDFFVEIKGQPTVVFTYEGEMPQEITDQYQQIVGNGLARVGLGIPMDRKVFGNGAGAHVSISLACNQDAQSIHAAMLLAQQAVLYYVKQNLAQALQEFNNTVGQLPQPTT